MSELRIVTADELKEVIRKHVLWLADEEVGERANLRSANLRSADLRSADLRYADLRSADLSNADLSNADLRSADLSNANLRSANLRYADLSNANLSNANLRYADLRSADLSSANLRSADLRSADLRSADLRYADLILVGQDIRGYLFWAYQNEVGVVVIRAGCRQFTGISAARAHWIAAHTKDEILYADCLSLVARCETMAKVRGWKLEAD